MMMMMAEEITDRCGCGSHQLGWAGWAGPPFVFLLPAIVSGWLIRPTTTQTDFSLLSRMEWDKSNISLFLDR
jgi:hypothetical protein